METPKSAARPTASLSGRLAVAVIVVAVLLAPFLFELGLASG